MEEWDINKVLQEMKNMKIELKNNKMENKEVRDFGSAIKALKAGYAVAREGWNGKGMFVFMRPHDNIDIQMIPKIKSLPQGVKDYLVNQFAKGETHFVSGNPIEVHFTEYLCMKDALGNIVNGWLASQTDMLAEDWTVVE